MKPRYVQDTTVPADRSRAEIERTLARYGATRFMYGWEDQRAIIAFEAHGRRIRFDLTDRKFKRYFCPGVYGSAPPGPPPPGRSMESLYCVLRLQVCSLALSGIQSHGGGGAYHFACLILTEAWP